MSSVHDLNKRTNPPPPQSIIFRPHMGGHTIFNGWRFLQDKKTKSTNFFSVLRFEARSKFLSTAKLGDNLPGSICQSISQCSHGWTAKSNKSHYQSKVFVCVSVIRGYAQIIVQRQSIDFFPLPQPCQEYPCRDLSTIEYNTPALTVHAHSAGNVWTEKRQYTCCNIKVVWNQMSISLFLTLCIVREVWTPVWIVKVFFFLRVYLL